MRGPRRPGRSTNKPGTPRSRARSRARSAVPRDRDPRDLPDHELTAEIVFRIPSVAEVVAAGYHAATLDRIREEAMEYRAKFNADPEFRTFAIEQLRLAMSGRGDRSF